MNIVLKHGKCQILLKALKWVKLLYKKIDHIYTKLKKKKPRMKMKK